MAPGRANLPLSGLIERVVVTWGEATRPHALQIEGRLGAILDLGDAWAAEVRGDLSP